MIVNRKEELVENFDFRYNYLSFVNWVYWIGDFKLYVVFILIKVRCLDSKFYGCEFGVGGFGKIIVFKIIFIVKVRLCICKRFLVVIKKLVVKKY